MKSVGLPPEEPTVSEPLPEIPPEVRLRLWPDPSVMLLEPVRVRALVTVSLKADPAVVAVVTIVALERARVEPLRVKDDVFPAVPLFVKEIASIAIVPMLLELVVPVVPPNTKPQVPDVVGSVDQFADCDQLVFAALPDHVVIGAAMTDETFMPVKKKTASNVANEEANLDLRR
jgi:hypothetical protein